MLIETVNDEPLKARIYSPHVFLVVKIRGEMDIDCLLLTPPLPPTRFAEPFSIALDNARLPPELINNLYLIDVYSTDPTTTGTFLAYIYLLYSDANGFFSLLAAQLDTLRAQGLPTSSDDIDTTTTTGRLTSPPYFNAIDDEWITHEISMTR